MILVLWQQFLKEMTTKAQATKEKIDKLDINGIKSSCAFKYAIK